MISACSILDFTEIPFRQLEITAHADTDKLKWQLTSEIQFSVVFFFGDSGNSRDVRVNFLPLLTDESAIGDA